MRRSAVLAPAIAGALVLSACGDARPYADPPGQTASAAECAGCHGDAATASRLSGAHAAHVAGAPALACGECHVVPAAVASPGHADGEADVVFGDRAGGAAAKWDAVAGSCAVACHGSLSGGAAKPVWTGDSGSLACGSCHAVPPPAPHTASTDCGSCHTGYSATAVNATLHRNGTVDVAQAAACGSCHGIPPPAPHTTSTSCGSCHTGYSATAVNAALHRNGTVDVAQTAACGSCHGIPPSTGRHGKHVNEGYSCGTCHAGASTSNGGPSHLNGVTNVSAPGWNATQRTCANSCHGTERW